MRRRSCKTTPVLGTENDPSFGVALPCFVKETYIVGQKAVQLWGSFFVPKTGVVLQPENRKGGSP